MLDQRGFEFIEREPFTPWLLNGFDVGAIATCHVGETQAEVSLHRNQDGVARFNRVGQSGLHGGTSGATHRESQAVIGLPGVTEEFLDFPHQFDIKRIEVADGRPSQSLKDRRMGVGRSRTQQQSIRGRDRGKLLAMTGVHCRERIRRRQG